MLIMEAWVREKVYEEIITKLQSNGYKFKHCPRGHTEGGEVALLHKETLDIILPKHPKVK